MINIIILDSMWCAPYGFDSSHNQNIFTYGATRTSYD